MFVRIVWSAIRAEAKVRGSLDEVPARLAKMKTPPRLKLRTDPRRPIKKQAGQRHPVRVVGDRRPPVAFNLCHQSFASPLPASPYAQHTLAIDIAVIRRRVDLADSELVPAPFAAPLTLGFGHIPFRCVHVPNLPHWLRVRFGLASMCRGRRRQGSRTIPFDGPEA